MSLPPPLSHQADDPNRPHDDDNPTTHDPISTSNPTLRGNDENQGARHVSMSTESGNTSAGEASAGEKGAAETLPPSLPDSKPPTEAW